MTADGALVELADGSEAVIRRLVARAIGPHRMESGGPQTRIVIELGGPRPT